MMQLANIIFVAIATFAVCSSLEAASWSWKFSVKAVDPEAMMNTTEMIRYRGYPCEDHAITTEDGFILGVQRIPHGRSGKNGGNRPVVLLQHGLMACSATWVDNFANQSLGYLMADAGMDVWLGNSRGNFYSSKHTKYNTKQKEFWDWTFDEMAEYDLPATINYILKTTQAQNIYYVGHSQGTMIGFAKFSRDQVLASKVKTFFALAPVAYFSDIKGAMKTLGFLTNKVEDLFDLLGVYDFVPGDELNKEFADICSNSSLKDFECEAIALLMGGIDFQNINRSRIPVYLGHTPSDTSVKNVVHYSQAMRNGKFQMYDYGNANANMAHYNQSTPPQYTPDKMSTPVVLHTGTNDWIADPKDFSRLKPQLKNIVQSKVIQGWEHLDFLWALNARQQSYEDIIQYIKSQSEIM